MRSVNSCQTLPSNNDTQPYVVYIESKCFCLMGVRFSISYDWPDTWYMLGTLSSLASGTRHIDRCSRRAAETLSLKEQTVSQDISQATEQ